MEVEQKIKNFNEGGRYMKKIIQTLVSTVFVLGLFAIPNLGHAGDMHVRSTAQVSKVGSNVTLAPSVCNINYYQCVKKSDNDDECYEVFLYCEQLIAERQDTRDLIDELNKLRESRSEILKKFAKDAPPRAYDPNDDDN